jgi:hypothetical protein
MNPMMTYLMNRAQALHTVACVSSIAFGLLAIFYVLSQFDDLEFPFTISKKQFFIFSEIFIVSLFIAIMTPDEEDLKGMIKKENQSADEIVEIQKRLELIELQVKKIEAVQKLQMKETENHGD